MPAGDRKAQRDEQKTVSVTHPKTGKPTQMKTSNIGKGRAARLAERNLSAAPALQISTHRRSCRAPET
jgi:hypothetical protein